MLVGDQDGPAAGRRAAGNRDVAAEADQHATVASARAGGRRGPVSAESLSGRAEVKQHTGRPGELIAAQLNRLPAGGCTGVL